MVGILIRLWHVLDYLLQISYDCMQYLYRYGFHYELKSMVWTTHDNKCMKHVYLCTVYVHIYAKNSGEFLLIWNVSCCYISGTFLALWSFVWICLLLPFTGPFHRMKKFIYVTHSLLRRTLWSSSWMEYFAFKVGFISANSFLYFEYVIYINSDIIFT